MSETSREMSNYKISILCSFHSKGQSKVAFYTIADIFSGYS